MAAVSGKELVRKLKATGTGETKLNVGRAVLLANPAATAAEVLKAMVDGDVGYLTLVKAKQIAETGDYTPPASDVRNIEDEPDPAPAPAPAPAPTPPSPPRK